jgi:hypothetical protein
MLQHLTFPNGGSNSQIDSPVTETLVVQDKPILRQSDALTGSKSARWRPPALLRWPPTMGANFPRVQAHIAAESGSDAVAAQV